MIVWTVPRETNASPPLARTRSETASISPSVALCSITMTMWSNLHVRPGRTAREVETPGGSARGRWLLGAPGDYAGANPTEKHHEPLGCCIVGHGVHLGHRWPT